jgi:hypothetical protein
MIKEIACGCWYSVEYDGSRIPDNPADASLMIL